jgi:hypothetical protein
MPNSKEIPELTIGLTTTDRHWSPRQSRDLYSADNHQSYLVDSSGNSYDAYSLAWRYLGLYIDCEISNTTNFYQYYNYNNGYSRKLPENNKDGECQRKLLWAAYVDPKYKGNAIEEYQFYDIKNGTYDDSACLASGTSHRCVRMDCHESHTHFQLVGVFKETDGMYDWTEQLFKHEGYCIWMGDEDGDGENIFGCLTYETVPQTLIVSNPFLFIVNSQYTKQWRPGWKNGPLPANNSACQTTTATHYSLICIHFRKAT